MIDTSKIRPGDTGTIRVRFREMGKDGVYWWIDADMPEKFVVQYLPIAPSAIASHTPAPWVPEKGDVVGWLVSKLPEWEIRAIDGEDTLIRSQYPNGVVRVEAALLSDLTLIRKGAA